MTDEIKNEVDDQEFSDAFAEATADENPQEQDDIINDDQAIDNDEPESEEPDNNEPTLEERFAALEKERDDYKHKFQSNAGRIRTYQSQIDELSAKVNQSVANGSTQEQAQEELAQQVNNSSWDELKEDFPEIADALESKLGTIDQKIEQLVGQRIGSLEQQIQPLTQKVHAEALQSEFAALEAAHPDYQAIGASEEFHNWLETKPDPVKQLISSNHAADAAYLLDTFKRDTGHQTEHSSSNKTQRNRERLASNIAVPSSRNTRRDVTDDDFGSAFDSAVKAKNRSRRY